MRHLFPKGYSSGKKREVYIEERLSQERTVIQITNKHTQQLKKKTVKLSLNKLKKTKTKTKQDVTKIVSKNTNHKSVGSGVKVCNGEVTESAGTGVYPKYRR